MSRKQFSEHTGIPVRTLEDWEAGRRTPPEYIPRLIAYQLMYEELTKGKERYVDEKVVISKMEITSPHGAIPGKTQSVF